MKKTSDCGFCEKGRLAQVTEYYYCDHCHMRIFKESLIFRGIPTITEDRARKLLAKQTAVFTCVSRTSGRPYSIDVRLLANGKLDIEFSKRKRKRA